MPRRDVEIEKGKKMKRKGKPSFKF